MERVLWPIEPVEPRIANFFTSFIFSEWNAPVLILRFEGHPPGGMGYFARKSIVCMGMQTGCVAKIFYLNGLPAKYSIQMV